MDDRLRVAMERVRACARRTQNAAQRVQLKHREIAKIEAAKGSSAVARTVLATLERELATHCEALEMLIEHVEHLARRE
jgi:hypothetical protein